LCWMTCYRQRGTGMIGSNDPEMSILQRLILEIESDLNCRATPSGILVFCTDVGSFPTA
jgi:hypothetical protein